MGSDSPNPGLFRRFLRWLFSWRILRRGLIAVVALVTLLVALITEENWRARHDWENFKAKREAKGEHFDLNSFIPTLPPPDQNFATTPFLSPLQDYKIVNGEVHWNDSNALAGMKSVSIEGADEYRGDEPSAGHWRRDEFCDLAKWQTFYRSNTNFPTNPHQQSPAQDVLFALGKFDAIFSELRAASDRPYAVLPFYYDPQLGDIERFSECKRLVRLCALRATAEVDAGQSTNAVEDIKLCLKLSKLLQQEPLLISQLVRLAMIEYSIQPIWEGLARHRWADEQLQELQKALAEIQPLNDYAFAMRGERAFGDGVLEQYRAGHFPANLGLQPGPLSRFRSEAFFYRNQLALNRMMDDLVLAGADGAQHRVFPERCNTNVLASVISKPGYYNILAWMSGDAFAKALEHFARTQSSIDLAIAATALERYRLAHGAYPETLDSLAPQFIKMVPNDVISGNPLKYRREPNGQFVLYSIGWDETDNGGEVVRKKNGSVDLAKGDWVWQYPAK